MDLASVFVPWVQADSIDQFSLGSSFDAFASFAVAEMKHKKSSLSLPKFKSQMNKVRMSDNQHFKGLLSSTFYLHFVEVSDIVVAVVEVAAAAADVLLSDCPF